MRRRDYHLYGDHARMLDLAAEYTWIGRAVKLDYRHLTVLAVNPDDLTKDRSKTKRQKNVTAAARRLEASR